MRSVPLDILRAVAVLLVIGRHLDPGGNSVLRLWRRGGWVGVDLFFVLSGFLVTGLLLREYRQHGTFAVGRFYLRRGLKIYPAFYLFLALTLPLAAVLRLAPTTTPSSLLSECLFLQSYVPGAWNHTWSLAVEEHFYLLLPLALALLARRKTADPFRPLGPICLGLALLLLLLRIATACGRAYDPYLHHFPTHLRLDALALGVGIAYYRHCHADAFTRILAPQRHRLIAAGCLLLVPAFFSRVERAAWVYTVGFSLFALGSALLVCGVLLVRPRPGAVARSLAGIGAQSYSVYLWHMPVILWGPALLERWLGVRLGALDGAAFALAGSVALGMALARLVELPVLRWRDRWCPSRATASYNDDRSTPVAFDEASCHGHQGRVVCRSDGRAGHAAA